MTQDIEWHYELKGKQRGPLSEDKIRSLIDNGTIDAKTLVWHHGFQEWSCLEDTYLSKYIRRSIPPPLPTSSTISGRSVTSVYLWLIVAIPIAISVLPETVVIFGETAHTLLLISLFTIILGSADGQAARTAGFHFSRWELIWLFFCPPIYLWRRSTRCHSSRAPFWMWWLALIIGLVIDVASSRI